MLFRSYLNTGPGTQVQDVTPKIPPELLPMIRWLIDSIYGLAEFPNIMQGQGEPGVRSMAHASTLLKTASPTLRDRALLVERQCAIHADLDLQIKEAKDAHRYWTKADTIEDAEKTSFLLTDLPDDWRVTVDSHSSSPIFSDENAQLIMAAHAKGMVQTEYAINNLPFPNREEAIAQNKLAAQEKQADRKSTRLNSSHSQQSRMPSSA